MYAAQLMSGYGRTDGQTDQTSTLRFVTAIVDCEDPLVLPT